MFSSLSSDGSESQNDRAEDLSALATKLSRYRLRIGFRATGLSCRLVRSPLLAIFLIVAVDVLGLTIMIPLLPFYAEKMGATPTQVGLLIGVYAACQLFSGPLLGRLSDHTGRKPLLLVSQVGTLIGFLILAFAPSLWVVFVARVIDGATAGNLSLAQAYISDVTKPEERARSFGVIGIAFGMGFLIGPAISGYLAKFDYRDPIFAAAGLSATSILATWLLLPSVKTSSAPAEGPGGRRLSLLQWGEYGRYFQQPALAMRLYQFLAFGFSFAMFTAGFPLFAERRLTWHGVPFGPEQVGFSWAYAGFLGIFLQGPALGKMVKKFGESSLNRLGFAAYAAGYLTLAFCFSIPVLIAATTFCAIGSLVRPTLTSMITQAAPREEQGVVLGLTQSLTSIAQITGPPVAGFLIQHGLLTGWGITAAAVASLGLLLASRPIFARS
jgi:DHA1 family tetracycline resistance protein-like MFS transporter